LVRLSGTKRKKGGEERSGREEGLDAWKPECGLRDMARKAW